MGLADKLAEINEQFHSQKCAYVLFLESMKEEDRKALEDAWANRIPQRVVLRALRAEGYRTSNEAIGNHKSGNCKCKKK